MVDDSHAVGFIGAMGRGTPSTAASWGASTSSPARWARRSAAPRRLHRAREIVELLRQRSRPYLFSNSLPPPSPPPSLKVLDLLRASRRPAPALDGEHALLPRG
jgi:glycine C-acetyltransferase